VAVVPVVLRSAHCDGVTAEAVLHALVDHLDLVDVGAGMTMVIGPDRSGDMSRSESSNATAVFAWCTP
jgi:hypothetical protein